MRRQIEAGRQFRDATDLHWATCERLADAELDSLAAASKKEGSVRRSRRRLPREITDLASVDVNAKQVERIAEELGRATSSAAGASGAGGVTAQPDILLQNLFLPSVKLMEKKRVGSRLRRKHDTPQTPLDRLVSGGKG